MTATGRPNDARAGIIVYMCISVSEVSMCVYMSICVSMCVCLSVCVCVCV